MEITVFANFDAKRNDTCLYRCSVSCPDAFDFNATLSVFHSLYGPNVLIQILCV